MYLNPVFLSIRLRLKDLSIFLEDCTKERFRSLPGSLITDDYRRYHPPRLQYRINKHIDSSVLS